MKNLMNIFKVSIFSLLLISLVGCDKETVMPGTDHPEEIVNYVETHFPENKIIQVIEDVDGFTKKYEVLLDGDFKLEFNRKKEIIDIEGRTSLPASVIPTPIQDYVAENFPENFIIGWELEGKNQQVELDNGLDIEFTMDGDFIRIDD